MKHAAHDDRVPGSVGRRVGIRIEARRARRRAARAAPSAAGASSSAASSASTARISPTPGMRASARSMNPSPQPTTSARGSVGRQVPRAHVREPVDAGIARGAAVEVALERRRRNPELGARVAHRYFARHATATPTSATSVAAETRLPSAEPRGAVRQQDAARAGIEAQRRGRGRWREGSCSARPDPSRGRPAAVLDERQDDVRGIGSADARREGGGVRRLRVVRDLDGRIRGFSAAVVQHPGRSAPVGAPTSPRRTPGRTPSPRRGPELGRASGRERVARAAARTRARARARSRRRRRRLRCRPRATGLPARPIPVRPARTGRSGSRARSASTLPSVLK